MSAMGSQLRVTMIPGDHDYTRSLCAHLPADQISLKRFSEELPARYMNPRRLLAETHLLHIHWPEHLFAERCLPASAFLAGYLKFIAAVQQHGCRIVWTLHNRGPHKKDAALFAPVYRAFAEVAHGVIHHSAWGEQLMRSELPFPRHCRHTVIYHGHYEEQMRCSLPRTALERHYGLTPTAMRLGVLGRAQQTKNVQLIANAFVRAARSDQQLLIDAIDAVQTRALCMDGRIAVIPRRGWLAREEVARRNHVVDALVVAHSGPSYLSSGLVADALALGLPMIVPRWGFFVEMLGEAGIYHDNTEAGLIRVLSELTERRLAEGRAAMSELKPRFAWSRLAKQTQAFYLEVMNHCD